MALVADERLRRREADPREILAELAERAVAPRRAWPDHHAGDVLRMSFRPGLRFLFADSRIYIL